MLKKIFKQFWKHFTFSKFSRQEYWSGFPCPPPGDLPTQRWNPYLMSPALACGLFTTSATWEAHHLLHSGSNILTSSNAFHKNNIVTQNTLINCCVIFQSLTCVQLFATPWIVTRQALLSTTVPRVCSNPCPLSQWCYLTLVQIETLLLHLIKHSVFLNSKSFLIFSPNLKGSFREPAAAVFKLSVSKLHSMDEVKGEAYMKTMKM